MSSYRIDELSVDQLDRISLPKFQRGFVWTKKKQEDFVQTLHDGYPFGTLLVYPENDNDKDAKLQLLDGQQRLSTIKKYRQDPLQFWKPLNRESYTSVYQSVKKMLPEGDKFTEPIFDKLVNSNPNKVAYWAMDSLSSKEDVKAAMQSIDDLKQQIRSFVNLEHLNVPMIVYLGGSAHIADVFANLNKGGVPLTKYEVFGAAWVNAAIRLRGAEESPLQDQLLQYVKNYYLDMRKQAEFDVDDFSEDELTQNRTVTLPEFGTALGQYVVDHLSALVPETTSAAPEIGFGLLGVAMNLDNRKLSSLNLSYLSASVPNGETFELEHIIARKRIDAADSSRPRHILGNSLGNCMYLPRGINNPKKDKTLYEINDHNRYSQLIKESQYFSEDEMQKAMQALTASDYESVNGLLRERSRQVAHTLVRALLKDSV